eukprot:6436-Heterococcus_DN1.PRE.3
MSSNEHDPQVRSRVYCSRHNLHLAAIAHSYSAHSEPQRQAHLQEHFLYCVCTVSAGCFVKASCARCLVFSALASRPAVKKIHCKRAHGGIENSEALITFYNAEHAAKVRTRLAEYQMDVPATERIKLRLVAAAEEGLVQSTSMLKHESHMPFCISSWNFCIYH